MKKIKVDKVILYFVYDVKVSEGWLKLYCISGDFEDFSMYKIK